MTAITSATWPPPKKETAASSGNSNATEDNTLSRNSTASRTLHKWERLLDFFAAGGDCNTFEASRSLGDSCLHSSIAGLSARGLVFQRQDETVAGRYGQARVTRYRLDPCSYALARELLAGAPVAGKGSADA